MEHACGCPPRNVLFSELFQYEPVAGVGPLFVSFDSQWFVVLCYIFFFSFSLQGGGVVCIIHSRRMSFSSVCVFVHSTFHFLYLPAPSGLEAVDWPAISRTLRSLLALVHPQIDDAMVQLTTLDHSIWRGRKPPQKRLKIIGEP